MLRHHSLPIGAIAGLLLIAACAAQPAVPPTAGPQVPSLIAAEIEFGANGRCYGRDISPAVLETVTAQVLETPAITGPDGAVVAPATYRSEIRQQIVRERQEVVFETLCPPDYTAEFVATLQRALAARGLFDGASTGVMDLRTGRAVQAFQRYGGPDSPLLSIAAARRLGIVALSDDQLAAMSNAI